MNDSTDAILERIAQALERIAARYCAEEARKTPRPAVLSRATYTREERELADFKAGIHKT
jgi:hypothetical protein